MTTGERDRLRANPGPTRSRRGQWGRALGLPFLLLPAVAAALSLTSTRFPLRVDYDSADQLDLATATLAAAESAWQRQIVELGYAPPFTGGGGVPVEPGMTFVLAPVGGAGNAQAQWLADVPTTTTCDCSARVVIDSSTSPSSPLLAEGTFHELNHATQYAVDCTEAPSAYEGFAIALVHGEFPDSTIVPWVISEFQRFPEYPLDYWTMTFPCTGQEPCFPYQLGAALFPLYLRDRFGAGDPRTLAQVFALFAQTGTTTIGPPHPRCSQPDHPDWFEGVDAFLRSQGSSFAEAFSEFSAWRAVVGAHDDQAHYLAGAEYAEPAVARRHALVSPLEGTLAVYEYGSRYVELEGLADAPRGRWHVAVAGDPAAAWSASVLVWGAAGPVDRLPLDFHGATGEAWLDQLDGVQRLLLVLSQLDDGSHVPDDMDYDSSRQLTYRLELEADDGGLGDGAGPTGDAASDAAAETPAGPSGCSCGAARALPGGGAFVLALAVGLARGRRRAGGTSGPATVVSSAEGAIRVTGATMRILGGFAFALLLLGCGVGQVNSTHDGAPGRDAPADDAGPAADGGPAPDAGPADGPPAADAGGSDGAAGQFGTGGTAAPQYVTDVTGGGAKPSAADGLAASCPGDCGADATDCLQAAADAARDAAKPLVIPAPAGACYRITHWVRVYGSVIGVDYPLIKVDGATGDSDHSALRVHGYAGAGMWITGLRIDGGWDPTGAADPGGGEWSSGIDLADSANITIRDNQIQNTAGDSIYLGSNGTGESNVIIDGNDLVNAYRCSIAFIHATGVTVTNNTITKLGEYVIALDFEPNDPPTEQVLDVEIAANATSVPNGATGCSMCTDFVVGASCSPNQGSAHGGSLFVHHNTVAAYMAANVTEGAGPGFGENNSSTWSGACAAQWQQGTNPHGGGFYVWDNPPGSGTTNGNSPPN